MSSVAGVNGASNTGTSSVNNPNSGFNQNQFLQLLVAQMKYQDPSQPMNASTMMNELAQFTSVEQMMNMQQATQMGTATSMIGKTATYTDPTTGQLTQGTVAGVTVATGNVSVTIGSSSIPFGNITGVA